MWALVEFFHLWCGGPANWIQKSGLRSDIFKSNMAYTLLTHVVIGHFLFIFYVGENFVLVVILE
jgi:hypothetical protein